MIGPLVLTQQNHCFIDHLYRNSWPLLFLTNSHWKGNIIGLKNPPTPLFRFLLANWIGGGVLQDEKTGNSPLLALTYKQGLVSDETPLIQAVFLAVGHRAAVTHETMPGLCICWDHCLCSPTSIMSFFSLLWLLSWLHALGKGCVIHPCIIYTLAGPFQ